MAMTWGALLDACKDPKMETWQKHIEDTIDEKLKNFKDELVARVGAHALRIQSDVIMLSDAQMKNFAQEG